MIKVMIFAEKGKVFTSFEKKELCLIDSSLMIRELEKVKNELVNLDFEKEYQTREEGGREE